MDYGLFDLLGSIGALLLMITYLLLQLDRISSSSIAYSLLNLIGATLITISLTSKFNLSALVIEVFWILISLFGIFRHLKLRVSNS